MKINTTRFGDIDVNEAEFIVMKGAILGFEQLKRFVLLQNNEKTYLWWLQSVDDPAVAFVVVNPLPVKPDYAPAFTEGDLELLDIKEDKDIAILAIVTVRSNPLKITANLRAPILINAEKRTASQVVLGNSDYPIQYDLADVNEHEGSLNPASLPAAP
ncbi:MAG: flagellar assembly protein FliW [Syntrophales bacterium]